MVRNFADHPPRKQFHGAQWCTRQGKESIVLHIRKWSTLISTPPLRTKEETDSLVLSWSFPRKVRGDFHSNIPQDLFAQISGRCISLPSLSAARLVGFLILEPPQSRASAFVTLQSSFDLGPGLSNFLWDHLAQFLRCILVQIPVFLLAVCSGVAEQFISRRPGDGFEGAMSPETLFAHVDLTTVGFAVELRITLRGPNGRDAICILHPSDLVIVSLEEQDGKIPVSQPL